MRIQISTILLAIFLAGCAHDEITVYSLMCDKPLETGLCKAAASALNPIHYKVFPDQQKVVYWFSGNEPEKLGNCAVRNKRNWSCEFPDGSAKQWMADGRYFKQVNPLKNSLVVVEMQSRQFQTSWAVWRAVSWGLGYERRVVNLLEWMTL